MNKAAVYHQPDSQYCFAIDPQRLVLRIRLAKEDKRARVRVIYGSKYSFKTKRTILEMHRTYEDHLHIYYEIELELADVRCVYFFQLEVGEEVFYFGEDGFSDQVSFEDGQGTYFQMPYINQVDVHDLVPWTQQAIFYQIFVDRFHHGDLDKDTSYITMAWSDKPRFDSFAGGDLKGITQKLSYLEDLGINALYLTPIFDSPSNHKYDTHDYFAVDPQFGSKMDLKNLIEKAHDRGFKVILDAVFNHSGNRSDQFQDVVKHGRASQFYDWFMIKGDYPKTSPLNYETFAFTERMPKWNTSHPQVQDYLLSVAKYWLEEFDIDGWRLDVADEVSHDFWRRFRKELKAIKPDLLILGENWHDSVSFLRGDQFDGVMNYAFTKAVIAYLKGEESDLDLLHRLQNIQMRNSWQVNQMNLNLLDSHDTARLLSQLGGSKDKVLLGLAVMLFYRGMPCLYYGTEIAMEGGPDPDCRRGFNWQEESWDKDYHSMVKVLLDIRRRLQKQDLDLKLYLEEGLLIMERSSAEVAYRLVINSGPEARFFQADNVLASLNWEGETLLAGPGFAIVDMNKKTIISHDKERK